MEWMGLNQLRESFLEFFESKGHYRLPSAPLVPLDDAGLLLINSGMAPLKKYFQGLETPPSKRVTTCQKCIRTPDIERVGKTSRHGTFFEMLGNFSFGEYFKEEATTWAWEFVTQTLSIPVDRLWISIFEEDDEAFDIWTKNRGVDPARIVRLGREDNFWEIGSGPCGPCSEMYYDYGADHGCGSETCAVGCDCDRFVEFWNLVFTQFNSDGNGGYEKLEHPNIDTGMGLERLACIMQNVNSLFEVDTIQNIMKHIATIANVEYNKDPKTDVSLRVITDHVRSTVFMVGDGVIPQNEGRGYVLRRLLRRAARHGLLLGIEGPFLYKVCRTVIAENADSYPALTENADYIEKIIQTEEERFLKTIQQGMEMLNVLMDKLSTAEISGGGQISGEDAFKLYDTFGFPLDLTKEIAQDNQFHIDEDSFLEHMQKQRERARAARSVQGDLGWDCDILAGMDIADRFIGYDGLDSTTKILAITNSGEVVSAIKAGDFAKIVLAKTPFYAESGGQIGDSGTITVGTTFFKVTDCKKSPTGRFLHIGQLLEGTLATGDEVTAKVSTRRRNAISRNHTAAHLLQAALRDILGDHVHQAGSMVSESICRFDFTHFSAMTKEELEQTEDAVNDMILAALQTTVREMPIADAKKLGAMALFGDKYSDIVRVCTVGDVSIELCGGTHVNNTAQLGLFKIIGESSVAAGVRRIEATTGRGVLDFIKSREDILNNTANILKVNSPHEITVKVSALTTQIKDLQKQLTDNAHTIVKAHMDNMVKNTPSIGNVKLMSGIIPGANAELLKQTSDEVKNQYPEIVGIVATMDADKATVLVFAGKNAVKSGVHCGKIVKALCETVGGSGGGRPDTAMGGIPDPKATSEVIIAAPAILAEMLGV